MLQFRQLALTTSKEYYFLPVHHAELKIEIQNRNICYIVCGINTLDLTEEKRP